MDNSLDNQVVQPVAKAESAPVTELEQYEQMNPEEKAKIDGILSEVNITDSAAVLQYGVNAQSDISNFSDSILKQVRAKDSGYVGDVLSELMVNVRNMDVEDLGSGKGVLGRFGSVKKRADKFMARYDKIGSYIDKAVSELDKSRMQLLKDISLLDGLYDQNLTYHQELAYYIIAGEKKIDELRTALIPELESKAKTSGDPADVQKLNDTNQLLNRFDKKVHDLRLSKVMALQTGPQIRLIQGNDQVLVEKIQSSILNTIPLWKNQIVIAISLMRQEKAIKQQQQVSKTTNDLLNRNSEMLKSNAVEVAKESEKGIVELETLKKVNQDLIDTIEETLMIQKEGRDKRAQAELELKSMEQQLKDKLLETKE